MKTKRSLLATLICLLFVATAIAQPKPSIGPSSTHAFPAGAQRGTTVSVAVGGECLPPGTRFVINDPAIHVQTAELEQRAPEAGEASQRRYPTETPITYPKQWSSQLTIPAAADLGTVFWRLSCAAGGTCSRPFLIGDLPELIEKESNSTPELAEEVELPITINGQISGERDVDYYRFTARAGDIVSCEVVARRLGSPLDANVTFHAVDGQELSSSQRYLGSDAAVALAVHKQGTYLLRISNVSFRGDPSHVYRLNLSKAPLVYSCFPAGGQPGSTRHVSLLAMSGTEQPLELQHKVTFPDNGQSQFIYRSADFANLIPLALTDGKHTTEKSLITDSISVPMTIDGRLDEPRDVDEFPFDASAGEWFSIHFGNRRFHTAALPALEVLNVDGTKLASANIAEAGHEGRLQWQAPETGRYQIRIKDLRYGSQGGAEYVYRLSVKHAPPDFSLTTPHDCINLVRGSEAIIDVVCERQGGFAGEIEIRFAGLPLGVEVKDNLIATGKNSTKVKLKADTDTVLGDATLRVAGVATIDDGDATRNLKALHIGADAEGFCVGPRTLDLLTLNVIHKQPFRLFCSEAYQYAHRGSVFMYPMEVERMNGFSAPITLQIGDRQNRDLDGIEMFEVTIPADASRIELPIYLPETMHINIQSQSQLYAQGYARFLDERKQPRATLILAEKRNMLRTLPPVVKLKTRDPEIDVHAGETTEIHLFLDRTKNFDGPMQISLVGETPPGLSIGSAEIPPGGIEAAISIQAAREWSHGAATNLRFRAVGQIDKTKLITEATIKIRRRPKVAKR